MQYQPPGAEQLEQIHALNRLFLSFLQSSLGSGADDLGFPQGAAGALRHAEPWLLETVAAFPRALFRLQLPRDTSVQLRDPGGTALDHSRQALTLTVLLTAWNLSRQSRYQARLFLGMENDDISSLRVTSLAELPRISRLPNLLRCAYGDSPALWRALLGQRGAALSPQLALIALQPPHAALGAWRRPAVELLPAG